MTTEKKQIISTDNIIYSPENKTTLTASWHLSNKTIPV